MGRVGHPRGSQIASVFHLILKHEKKQNSPWKPFGIYSTSIERSYADKGPQLTNKHQRQLPSVFQQKAILRGHFVHLAFHNSGVNYIQDLTMMRMMGACQNVAESIRIYRQTKRKILASPAHTASTTASDIISILTGLVLYLGLIQLLGSSKRGNLSI